MYVAALSVFERSIRMGGLYALLIGLALASLLPTRTSADISSWALFEGSSHRVVLRR